MNEQRKSETEFGNCNKTYEKARWRDSEIDFFTKREREKVIDFTRREREKEIDFTKREREKEIDFTKREREKENKLRMENGRQMKNENCKSGVICALITFSCEITFGAHMTHDD